MILVKSILIMIMILTSSRQCYSQQGDKSDSLEIRSIAVSFKNAIIDMNSKVILGYISPKGVRCIDDHFSYHEIQSGLELKGSRIYGMFYSGKYSAKTFFRENPTVEIIINKMNVPGQYWAIAYCTEEGITLDCVIKKINKKWLFVNLFERV